MSPASLCSISEISRLKAVLYLQKHTESQPVNAWSECSALHTSGPGELAISKYFTQELEAAFLPRLFKIGA